MIDEEKLEVVPQPIYKKLLELGMLDTEVRGTNVGTSDYSNHFIQPWAVWKEYSLNAWDADIIKRVLRTKQGDSRITDYEKIKHICDERIRQLKLEELDDKI